MTGLFLVRGGQQSPTVESGKGKCGTPPEHGKGHEFLEKCPEFACFFGYTGVKKRQQIATIGAMISCPDGVQAVWRVFPGKAVYEGFLDLRRRPV